MGFMRPVAEHMEMYEVETNSHHESVPAEVLNSAELELVATAARTKSEEAQRAMWEKAFGKYIEGREVYSVEKKKGWFGRLSAPGYMDATEWSGPFSTEKQALEAVMNEHDVDKDGDSVD